MAAPSVASAADRPDLGSAGAAGRNARLAAVAREHFDFIWRSLRRLGVPPGGVDDAAQQVFEVLARRLADIEAGRERAFLFKTALLVATEARRLAARSHARTAETDLEALHDAAPTPEESALLGEKRVLLDRVLHTLELDMRTVFVLYEIEGLELREIGELVGIPRGTAASRLRRAREAFQGEVRRLRARLEFPGGPRE